MIRIYYITSLCGIKKIHVKCNPIRRVGTFSLCRLSLRNHLWYCKVPSP